MNISEKEKKELINFREATMKNIISLEDKEEEIKEEISRLWDVIYYIDNRIE